MKPIHKVINDSENKKLNTERLQVNKNWGMGIIVFLSIIILFCINIIQHTNKKATIVQTKNNTSRSMHSDSDDRIDQNLIQVTRLPSHIPTGLPKLQTVVITQGGFMPITLTVKKDTVVTFINQSLKDAILHSDATNSPLNLGVFSNSDSLSITLTESGTYTYDNKNNPGQQGVIVVQ